MSLALTRRELSFRRRVRVFTEKHLKPLAARIEAEEFFPRDFLRALGKHRFLGAPFSRADGGLGLGWGLRDNCGRRSFRCESSRRDGKARFSGAVLGASGMVWK